MSFWFIAELLHLKCIKKDWNHLLCLLIGTTQGIQVSLKRAHDNL